MNPLLARLGHGLLDLVYPPMCLVCEDWVASGTLCERCVQSFAPVLTPGCPVCGRPIERETCGNCARFLLETGAAWAFDGCAGSAVYAGALRHAVHLLKYRNKENIAAPLGAFLADRLVADDLLPGAKTAQVVAPVPMHPHRERGRGFNQARLLAAPVADALGVPCLAPEAFVRTRKTAPQVGQVGKKRRANLDAEAFAVPNEAAISGKSVLLIDDVFTTGSTVNACAAALKRAGASAVWVACLAAGG